MEETNENKENNILDNLSVMDAWEVLESMNMDKILDITKDEYIFIASLPQNMSDDEIMAQLFAYRTHKNITRKGNE